jgi:hypothetical protein
MMAAVSIDEKENCGNSIESRTTHNGATSGGVIAMATPVCEAVPVAVAVPVNCEKMSTNLGNGPKGQFSRAASPRRIVVQNGGAGKKPRTIFNIHNRVTVGNVLLPNR